MLMCLTLCLALALYPPIVPPIIYFETICLDVNVFGSLPGSCFVSSDCSSNNIVFETICLDVLQVIPLSPGSLPVALALYPPIVPPIISATLKPFV